MDGEVVIDLDLNSKNFDAQIVETEDKLNSLVEEYETALKDKDFPKEGLLKYQSEIEKTQNKLVALFSKKDSAANNQWGQVTKQTTQINNNLSQMIKKVTRYALAIFGIRSAYSLIRQAMSSVLAGNEKMKTQFDGMKQSFYNAFAPIIEKIINLMKTLMAYVNYIWQRLFHHALFAEKGVLNASKKAKELNKQMAGFDEAEALSDNKSSSADGGNYDLGLSNVKIPDWLVKIMDWVEKHPTLSKIIFGLAAFTLFGGWKLASGIGGAIASILGSAKGGTGLLGLQALLAGGAIAGVAYLTWEGFDLLGEHVAGLGELVDTYKALKKEQKQVKDDTKSLGEKTRELNSDYLEHAAALEKGSDERKKYIDGVFKNIEIDRKYRDTQKDNKEAMKQYKETMYSTARQFEELRLQGNLTEEEEYRYYKFLKQEMANGLDMTNEKLGITASSFNELDKKYQTQYTIDMKTEGENKVKTSVNAVKDAFEKLGKKISDAFKLGEKTGVKVTDLAKNIFHANGGIVNLPGRGVPVTHYAGEAGREGIIPMDNASQMSLLGQEIAKYVNINNIVNNYMDARKINSILQASADKEKLANNG